MPKNITLHGLGKKYPFELLTASFPVQNDSGMSEIITQHYSDVVVVVVLFSPKIGSVVVVVVVIA